MPNGMMQLKKLKKKMIVLGKKRIKEFIIDKCNRPIKYTIDETTLNSSHRNNKKISY